MKRVLLLIATFLTLATGGVLAASPAFAAGNDVLNNACGQTAGSGKSSACDNKSSTKIAGKDGVLARVTKIVSIFAGITAIIIIIVGGMMFITSNGDANKAGTARSTILYAAIGLVVIALAQTIITFVVNRL